MPFRVRPQLVPNGYGKPNYILAANDKPVYMDQLESKTIGTILLTACSTGDLNYDSNVASQLAMSQDVNQVIAPDGL